MRNVRYTIWGKIKDKMKIEPDPHYVTHTDKKLVSERIKKNKRQDIYMITSAPILLPVFTLRNEIHYDFEYGRYISQLNPILLEKLGIKL